jgi:hypothetical protein
MAPETVSLVASVMFLLIALVGGGFSARELVIPRIPNWARVVSALLGIAFALPALWPPDSTLVGSQARETTIYLDTYEDTSSEKLRLSSLEARSVRNPPSVGDRITIIFTLTNVGRKSFPLVATFVAAHDPTENSRSFGISNPHATLAPNARVTVKTSVIPDSAGSWSFWPCYAFEKNGQETYCPNEWKAFPVSVQPAD